MTLGNRKLRYRPVVIEKVWAEQLQNGKWLVKDASGVESIWSDSEFQKTWTVDDTGLGTHLNQFTGKQ